MYFRQISQWFIAYVHRPLMDNYLIPIWTWPEWRMEIIDEHRTSNLSGYHPLETQSVKIDSSNDTETDDVSSDADVLLNLVFKLTDLTSFGYTLTELSDVLLEINDHLSTNTLSSECIEALYSNVRVIETRSLHASGKSTEHQHISMLCNIILGKLDILSPGKNKNVKMIRRDYNLAWSQS